MIDSTRTFDKIFLQHQPLQLETIFKIPNGKNEYRFISMWDFISVGDPALAGRMVYTVFAEQRKQIPALWAGINKVCPDIIYSCAFEHIVYMMTGIRPIHYNTRRKM
jgi:hypothetical protein